MPHIRTATARFDRLDALRGLAMVWMTAYHFSFDLSHFGYWPQDFYADPVWTWQRTAIVSLFLFTAGAGQAIAVRQGQGWPRFWRRWAQIAACALAVSVSSWWMFGPRYIHFGVLHGMAVMLPLTRLLLLGGMLRGARGWVAGAALIAITPIAVEAISTRGSTDLLSIFNSRWLNWLGVVSFKPLTEDYVPVLPWLGVMLLGAAVAQWVISQWSAEWQQAPGQLGRALAVLGRWSLTYYMVHQPLLIGALMAVAALRR